MAPNPKAIMLVLVSSVSIKATPFILTDQIDAGSCASLSNIQRLVGYYLWSMTVLFITSHSAAMVRLCTHLDPRSAILLDEAIHALDCPVHPVSVCHGGQCAVHLSAGKKAPHNEGVFLTRWEWSLNKTCLWAIALHGMYKSKCGCLCLHSYNMYWHLITDLLQTF